MAENKPLTGFTISTSMPLTNICSPDARERGVLDHSDYSLALFFPQNQPLPDRALPRGQLLETRGEAG